MVFLFGTIVASTTPKGRKEKFKILNPNKIPCNVNFAVKPRTNSKSEGFAFEVHPATARIPPHEYTYVKVAFTPTSMMSYGGIFEAVVENGELSPKTGALRFELRGEGTLPTIM
jgi:hydrocephalus-inducing protein